ncbi:alkaline phosphatase family protein [Ureibacillus acetophenoni]|uniref:Type I phosphodiesterase/nucleotide pyrophosphatase n=1 Tax=Ureibacillus acetophenoni TaxID=614649 RepID=A0A285URS6_9BACL|nr:alkaline phosphatase family protein [Ureibacillus acetophenoni]SOC44529.1 type I phosphodiesterase/nucleotide pyrophosphatase [Ureibacillus acetophenoni]
MKKKILIGLILFICLCIGLVFGVSMSPTKELNDVSINTTKKPVVLITVDSLMLESLQQLIKDGKAPAFSFLINNGQLYPEVISSYPTMSVTIDSTLLTGTYADQHKIPGLIWFKEDENRMVSYGSGLREIWNNGVKRVAADSILHLNQSQLSKEVQTIHEELAQLELSSASINGLLYRGNEKQTLNVPKLISLAKLLPNEIEVDAPTLLSLGSLAQYNPDNDGHKFIWNRMGVNNQFTVNELKYLIKQNKLPAFTLAYLPDADRTVHKNGPNDKEGIEKADQALQDLLNSFSSWEEAIDKATWIVHGDSGQSLVKEDKNEALIDLNEVLKGHSFWEGKNENAQLAIAINERSAYIYVNDHQVERSEIIQLLKEDERIGFIAWKEEEINYVISPEKDEELTFSPMGTTVDDYNQSWQLEGDLSILDLAIDDLGILIYKDYPDALARLHGALHSQEGNVIVVDAKPSYEFVEEHSKDHAGGGAHGSLHKVDSLVPLIVVGTDETLEYPRLVDLKKWILQLMSGS